MIERIIRSDACVAEGAAWLVETDPRFAITLASGPLPLRLKDDGFGALLGAILGQQVSVPSATAIWQKLQDAGLTTQPEIAAQTEDHLRALGLSRQKARYALALADANIDYKNLREMPAKDVIATLTAVKGIGTWTAEVYTMFSLGRADVFAPGDLALQEAARVLFDLDARPTEKELRILAQAWSPWRSVAARALWAHYRVIKSREGIAGY